MAGENHVDHKALKRFAENRVNVAKEDACKRREQVGHLRARLEAHISVNPDYDLVKLRASGSTAKHTAIKAVRGEGSDADVAAYLRTGDPDLDEAKILEWLHERCVEVYGKTKVADDFTISQHAVGIVLRGSGLKIDVAPVLYLNDPDDQGYLVTRRGERVLTSVTLHLRFIAKRKAAAGPGYAELIRLLKAWIRHAKRHDPQLRCKSFLLELVVAHLWEVGWHAVPLQVNDYPAAFEQVLSYLTVTELKQPIVFNDFYQPDAVGPSTDAVQIWDPVNAANNVASTYSDLDRRRLVDLAGEALDNVSWAATTPAKGTANDAWRQLFGPTFPGI